MTSTSKGAAVRVFVLLQTIVALLFSECRNPDDRKSGSISAAKIFTKYDFVTTDEGQLIHIEDSFEVFRYKTLSAYSIPYIREEAVPIVRNDTIEEKITKSEILQKLYFFKEGQPTGYQYNFRSLKFDKPFRVDSFINFKALGQHRFFNFVKDSLVESHSSGTHLLEKYIPRSKPDDSFPDSVFLYFSDKLTGLKFSLSSSLDSLKNSKLYKVVLLYNPITKGKFAFDVPRRVFSFELIEKPYLRNDSLLRLFKLYEQVSSKLNVPT